MGKGGARDSAVPRAELAWEAAAAEAAKGLVKDVADGSSVTMSWPEPPGKDEDVAERLAALLRDKDLKEEVAEASGVRAVWPRPRHFLYTSLSSVLGVGGLFYLSNGLVLYGGAFVVASAVLLLAVHLPLAFLETGLGQFSSSGPLHVFRHVLPVLEAVGWTQLLLGLFYGVGHGYFCARTIYFFFAMVAGNGGTRCADPAREPDTHNSPYCTSGRASRDCAARGTADQPRWLVAGQCYTAFGVDTHLLPRLDHCWAAAASHEDFSDHNTTFCAVSLHLFFNGTAPIDFFRLNDSLRGAFLSPRSRAAQDQDAACFKELFLEKSRCKETLQPTKDLDWGARMELAEDSAAEEDPPELVVDLRHWSVRRAETLRRAACLHRLLLLASQDTEFCRRRMEQEPLRTRQSAGRPRLFSAPSPAARVRERRGTRRLVGSLEHGHRDRPHRHSATACLILRYCAETFLEEAVLSDMECFRRVLKPLPSYSSDERDKLVYSHLGPGAEINHILVVNVLIVWPFLVLLVWRGVRRIGHLSFFTGAMPLVMVVGQCLVLILQPELHPGALWSLRMEWCRLLEPGLWTQASAVNFFSLSLGKGTLMSLASYNGFHQDWLRDVGLVGLVGFVTCVPLAATGIGYQVAFGQGLGLSPEQIFASGLAGWGVGVQSLDEQNQAFSLASSASAFFFVLTTTGAVVLGLVTAVTDQWEELRLHWGLLTAVASAALLLPCLAYAQSDGTHRLNDHVLVVESLLTPATQLVLLLLLAYVYGARRLLEDFALMADGGPEYREDSHFWLGRNLVTGPARYYLLASWTAVTPVALAALTVAAVAERAKEPWPWALLGGLSLLFPVSVLYSVFARRISPLNLFRARLDWGPCLSTNKLGRYSFMALRTEAVFGRSHAKVDFRRPERGNLVPGGSSSDGPVPVPDTLPVPQQPAPPPTVHTPDEVSVREPRRSRRRQSHRDAQPVAPSSPSTASTRDPPPPPSAAQRPPAKSSPTTTFRSSEEAQSRDPLYMVQPQGKPQAKPSPAAAKTSSSQGSSLGASSEQTTSSSGSSASGTSSSTSASPSDPTPPS